MNESKFHLSKLLKTSDKLYMYDALCNRLIELHKKIFDDSENIINFNKFNNLLKNNDFRDPNDFVEFDIKYFYTDNELSYIINNNMASVVLTVTEQCNLRCKYCGYMFKYKDPCYELKYMSEDVALRSIDFLMNSSKNCKYIYVSFYGGEPLLKFDLIKKCVEYCKKKYPFKFPIFNVVTNALILNDKEIIKYLIENDFYLNVSIDGPKTIHDKYRIDADGNPTFDRVYDNLMCLFKFNPEYFKTHVTLNSVISPTTGTKEQYDFLDKLCKSEILLIDVTITDYFSKHIENESKIERTENDYQHPIFNKNRLKDMKKYHSILKNTKLSKEILPGGFCIPGVRKNFVTVDGKILVCEKVDENCETFFIGDVYNGIDIKKIRELINNTLEKAQKCRDCWTARFCGLCFKDIFSLTDEFCEKAKEKIERDLIYYLEVVLPDKKLTNYLDNLSVT